MTGFDTQYGLVVQIYNKTMKKKTLGFWIKCGFEINKEIKDRDNDLMRQKNDRV